MKEILKFQNQKNLRFLDILTDINKLEKKIRI